MRNPVSITVEVAMSDVSLISSIDQSQSLSSALRTPISLENWFIKAEYDQRLGILVDFLNHHSTEKIIVFVSTCACVDYYSSVFSAMINGGCGFMNSDLKLMGFHGKLSPKIRNGIYERFLESGSGIMITTDVAARGIDIPDVDWVIQFAAPKDPAFFVHRVGRTARAGRKGNALLLISEDEKAYVEFLHGRGVVLCESSMEFPGHHLCGNHQLDRDVMGRMQCLLVQDRDLLEASSKAFISFLRAYKEHQCAYIFRFDRLNLGAVARCYALLKLPKILETRHLKDLKSIDFEPFNIDTSTIPYLHDRREHKRQADMQQKNIQYDRKRDEIVSDKLNKQSSSSKQSNFSTANQKRLKNKKKNNISYAQTMLAEWNEYAYGITLIIIYISLLSILSSFQVVILTFNGLTYRGECI